MIEMKLTLGSKAEEDDLSDSIQYSTKQGRKERQASEVVSPLNMRLSYSEKLSWDGNP